MMHAKSTRTIKGRLQLIGLDDHFFTWLSKIFFILVLIKHSGVRYWPHVYAGQAPYSSRLVYYPEFIIGMMALALFVLFFHEFKPIIRRHAAVILFVLFALLIRFIPGSQNSTSFLTILGYVDALVAVALILILCGPTQLRDLLAKFGIFFIAINLASLAIPSVSMMIANFTGFARGLTAHRNDLAPVSAVSIFLILCAPYRISPMVKWGAVLGGVVLVGLAGSVQGYFLLSGGLAMYFMADKLRWFKHPYFMLSIMMLIAIVASLWSYFSLDEFLRFFGRDATFTGRDRIWGLTIYLINEMPWSGYGIGAVGSDVVSVALLQSFMLGTVFGTAHNSYIETILSFGWIGGGLFLLAVIIESIRVFLNYIIGVTKQNALPAMIMLVCVVGGLTESKLFMPEFGWLSFVLAIFLNDYAMKAADAKEKSGLPNA